jgi:hypothetical protein
MTEIIGWPGKPGVPLNPEQDGPHWLKGYTEDACMWQDEGWYIPGYSHKLDAETVAARYSYIAPVLTPAEVDARIATAHKEWLAELNHDTDALMEEARLGGLEEAARVAKGFEGNDHLWSQHRWPLDDAWESASQAADIIAAAIRALKGEGNE